MVCILLQLLLVHQHNFWPMTETTPQRVLRVPWRYVKPTLVLHHQHIIDPPGVGGTLWYSSSNLPHDLMNFDVVLSWISRPPSPWGRRHYLGTGLGMGPTSLFDHHMWLLITCVLFKRIIPSSVFPPAYILQLTAARRRPATTYCRSCALPYCRMCARRMILCLQPIISVSSYHYRRSLWKPISVSCDTGAHAVLEAPCRAPFPV